jgi:hypothetical protein
MRYMNHDRGRRNIHISSSAPDLVDRGYHRIWGSVKRIVPTAIPWGSGDGDEIVEKMKGKLSYQLSGSLLRNDEDTLKQACCP